MFKQKKEEIQGIIRAELLNLVKEMFERGALSRKDYEIVLLNAKEKALDC